MRKRTEAVNSYESMLYGARNEVNDDKKLGKVLSEADKAKIKEEIKKHVEWLEKNQNSEAAEYKKRESEFVTLFRKIVDEAQKGKQKSQEKRKPDKDEM